MFFLLIPVIIVLILKKAFFDKRGKCIVKKHVVVTGGSSGIGKCIAITAAQQGAHVSILARNRENLNKAREEIEANCLNIDQKITAMCLDVSQRENVVKVFNEIEKSVGDIYMLVNCAGLAIGGKLEDISAEDIKKMLDINLLGTIYCTQAVVKKMKLRKEGIITMTASQAALVGLFGFTIYSSSKFALRGLAESLDMEVRPYNITVTLAVPPDTDTPGLEAENKTKPIETKLISESAGLYKPDIVAKNIFFDSLEGKFFSYIGFESYLLTTLCVGMTPFSWILEVFFQAFFLGPFRIISCIYLKYFQCIIAKYAKEEDKNK